jgi:quercetin dioxygenase-like cupin family protein
LGFRKIENIFNKGTAMFIARKKTSPRYLRDGITSYLLVSEVTTGSVHITTSLVEMSPGGQQHIHSHQTEQCYYILEGEGLMTVGRETQRVAEGDCIFIPSNEPHGLNNDGKTILKYFSAGAPSFGKENLLKLWPLKSENEIQDQKLQKKSKA